MCFRRPRHPSMTSSCSAVAPPIVGSDWCVIGATMRTIADSFRSVHDAPLSGLGNEPRLRWLPALNIPAHHVADVLSGRNDVPCAPWEKWVDWPTASRILPKGNPSSCCIEVASGSNVVAFCEIAHSPEWDKDSERSKEA